MALLPSMFRRSAARLSRTLSIGPLVLAVLASPLHAAAGDQTADGAPAPLLAQAADAEDSSDPALSRTAWEVSLTPYIWLAGVHGDVGIPNLPPAEVDASFGDIFDNLKMAAMLTLDARRDRFVVVGDIAYVDLGIEKNVGVRDPAYANAKLGMSSVMGTAAAGYRVVDRGALYVDVIGGLRVTSLTTELDLTGPVRNASGKGSKTWVDPVIGLRAAVPLGQSWSLNGYGDVGGFGAASDITWQMIGTVQHRESKHWNFAAGWRYFAIDYSKSGFLYDVSMSGPIASVSYRF